MLNEQLQAQIEQEAKDEAKKMTARVPAFRIGYEAGHYDAAEKYALKWQEAEQKATRYEKALKEIQAKVRKTIFPAQACTDFDRYITELLTPKQTTDDAANG